VGNPIFIRTAEGVLLRFEDASVARRWIESGRIQWSDRFLGTDQAWHPLTDLLDFSQAGRASPATPPAFPAAGTPPGDAPGDQGGVPAAGPEDIRRTAEWVSPAPAASPSAPVPVSPVPGPSSTDAAAVQEPRAADRGPASPGEGPTRSDGARETSAVEPDGEWWASDPGGSRTFPVRRIVLLLTIAVAVMAGALAIWWTGRNGPGDDGSPVRPDAILPGGIEDPGMEGAAQGIGPDAGREDRGVAHPDPGVPNPDPGGPADDAGSRDPEASGPAAARDESAAAGTPRGESESGAARGPVSVTSEEADTYDAHMEAGNRLASTRPDAAMAHFRRAAQLRPNRVEPVSRQGDLAIQQGDLAGAERYYREAIRRNAEYGPTMLGMARLKQRRGDRDDARYWYTRYLERFPQGSGASEARAFLESP